MRVCYFHSADFPEAVAALPDWAERIDTSARPYAYWDELTARWGQREALVTVDQDVVLVPGVITGFANCSHVWCVYPYSYGPDQLLCHSMGCTRFRREIQWELPAGPLPWNEYDGAVRE